MKHIVLTAEQYKILGEILGETRADVEVRDNQGRPFGRLTPLTPDEMEAIEHWKSRRGNQGPGIPSAQVQAHLQRLDEIRRSEGLDEPKMLELLRRMQAGEQV